MKKLLIVLAIISTNSLICQEVLNNQSIIDLVSMGLDSEIIISKIKTTDCDFNTETDELMKLKEQNIPNEIISAMIECKKEELEEGIFYYDGDQLKKINPNAFMGTNADVLASAFTFGLAGSKMKSSLSTIVSRNLVSTKKTEFIFQFNNDNSAMGQLNWWFVTASSPESFALVKLKPNQKKRTREIVIGSTSLAGYQIGVREKDMILFDFEKIGEGRFIVKPKSELNTGEYCFIYKGTYTGYLNQSVFDFSLK